MFHFGDKCNIGQTSEFISVDIKLQTWHFWEQRNVDVNEMIGFAWLRDDPWFNFESSVISKPLVNDWVCSI